MAIMKTTDLMIGDYIQDFAGDLCQVIVLDRQVAQVETLTGVHQGDTTRYLHEAEGIPLTPEILEKNGFIRASSSLGNLCGWYLEKDSVAEYYLIDVTCNNNRLYIEIHGSATIEKYCDYVHELQHELKLCKIEKEIVL